MIIRVKLCVAYVLSVLLLTVAAFLILKPAAVNQTSIILATALALATVVLVIDIVRDREKLKGIRSWMNRRR